MFIVSNCLYHGIGPPINIELILVFLERKIKSFSKLGKFLKQFDSVSFNQNPEMEDLNSIFAEPFMHAINQAELHNPWFTKEFIQFSFSSLSAMLREENLRNWLNGYPELQGFNDKPKKVGIIMAGNIPLVGFHDLLTVCFSGHKAIVKMASKDRELLPVIHNILSFCDPVFKEIIVIPENFLKDIDAVIATGSDNSSRYFEYYFGKYPHIIRKNRNSVAILTGQETESELKKLADDIFLYFGMGCRNVSKIFIPGDFNIPRMLDNFESYSYLYNHNKYANNYDYYRAIYLINKDKHFDTGYLLLKEDTGYSSPVGVVYFEYYDSLPGLNSRLKTESQQIQCFVSRKDIIQNSIDFGTTQEPGLNDYADNSDTLKFLINLYKK